MLKKLLCALVVLAPCALRAAEIKVVHTDDLATPLILVSGELQLGDGEAFAIIARRAPHAIVVFGSPGGALIAGLQIGQLIRLHRYPTFVPEDVVCASACALAWVAGVPRFMQAGARIGFHAAFDRDSHEVTGAGNALVGAYLNRLGVSDDAIYFAAQASPDDITWLTEPAARKIGLDVRIIPASATSHSPAEAPPQPTARPATAKPTIIPPSSGPTMGTTMLPFMSRPEPAPPVASSAADRAKAFVGDYFAHWSETADQALAFFAESYASHVNFYGTPVLHGDLLKLKRDYTARWPVRVYAARPDSLRAFCNSATSTCVVTGVVDWDCRSPERNARSAGSANFSLTVAMSGSQEQILAEAGSVISRAVD